MKSNIQAPVQTMESRLAELPRNFINTEHYLSLHAIIGCFNKQMVCIYLYLIQAIGLQSCLILTIYFSNRLSSN